MTHRSPLVTLVGLVAAFAIMFGVNLASSAAPGTCRRPAPTAAASAPPVASVRPTVRPRPTSARHRHPDGHPRRHAEQDRNPDPGRQQFPNKIVYAGRTEDGTTALAVAVLRDQAAAYLCDGRSVESWLRGTAKDGEVTLTYKNGAQTRSQAGGRPAQRHDRGSTAQAHVHNQGGQETSRSLPGARFEDHHRLDHAGGRLPGRDPTTGEEASTAPELDPDKPEVTATARTLKGEPVSGDQDV